PARPRRPRRPPARSRPAGRERPAPASRARETRRGGRAPSRAAPARARRRRARYPRSGAALRQARSPPAGYIAGPQRLKHLSGVDVAADGTGVGRPGEVAAHDEGLALGQAHAAAEAVLDTQAAAVELRVRR